MLLWRCCSVSVWRLLNSFPLFSHHRKMLSCVVPTDLHCFLLCKERLVTMLLSWSLILLSSKRNKYNFALVCSWFYLMWLTYFNGKSNNATDNLILNHLTFCRFRCTKELLLKVVSCPLQSHWRCLYFRKNKQNLLLL